VRLTLALMLLLACVAAPLVLAAKSAPGAGQQGARSVQVELESGNVDANATDGDTRVAVGCRLDSAGQGADWLIPVLAAGAALLLRGRRS
jgi:hypothetical protein